LNTLVEEQKIISLLINKDLDVLKSNRPEKRPCSKWKLEMGNPIDLFGKYKTRTNERSKKFYASR
jgi:hypothetical protein